MAGKKIGWGLIGASTIAREWMVDAIRSNEDSVVVGVASGDPGRAAALASEKGIPLSCGSPAELLQNPEIAAVYISTTNEQHAPLTLMAAEAGKHVLCEKPLATTLDQAQAMVDACDKAGVVFGTNHHLRNMESHRAIKRLIDEGAIGPVRAIRVFHAGELPESLKTWRLHTKAAGGGVIFDIGVHDADLLRFYLGQNPSRITAIATTSGDGPADIEDSVMSVWEFPGNILAQCHDSFVIGTAPRGVEVHGVKGSILGVDVMSQAPGGTVILRTQSGDTDVPFEHRITYERGVADFVAAIHGKGSPSATGEDGVWSLRLALAVAESSATGLTIAIG